MVVQGKTPNKVVQEQEQKAPEQEVKQNVVSNKKA
jgi:hypothetical protein